MLVLRLVFSLTRVCARWLIDRKYVTNFWGIIGWNYAFYCVVVSFFTFCLTYKGDMTSEHGKYILLFLMILTLIRINELVAAFFWEAIGRLKESKPPKLDIKRDERVTLLVLAYGETVFQFAILYFCIFCYFGSCAFNDKLSDIRDALYLSGSTITTTGYGDVLPTSYWSRLACVYEALIGIVFIAMALAAYLGERDSVTTTAA